MKRAEALMVQGTGSHVGKSVVTALLCAHFRSRGYRVAPFKAQNMSNNAAVTVEGGEIGRAQAVQAEACGLEPSHDMNPVLLKSGRRGGVHVVVNGRPAGDMTIREYYRRLPEWTRAVRAAYDRLATRHDLIVLEGAGSPAEVNLERQDLVNMAMAEYADAAVVLVGDIERGGVFAALLGTWEALAPARRKRIKGFLINKFRGDERWLASGFAWLKRRTGVPTWGVLPYVADLGLPEEDGMGVGSVAHASRAAKALRVAVVGWPHIANFTDCQPFKAEPDVSVGLALDPRELAGADAIVIPGSKSTMADLAWLRARGFGEGLARAANAGLEVVGVCGGYQAMGKRIEDPRTVEGSRRAMPGLGLLPMVTRFEREKRTATIRGRHVATGEEIRGYEIHLGRISPIGSPPPVFRLWERQGASVDEGEGLMDRNGRVWGTSVHGVFEAPGFRRAWLNRLRRRRGWAPLAPRKGVAPPERRLAALATRHLNLAAIERLVQ